MSDVDRHELLCKEEIKLLESMEGVEQTKNDINDGKQLNCDKITKESCQLNSRLYHFLKMFSDQAHFFAQHVYR